MIPKTNTVKVETFGGAVSRKMTIDAASAGHLMTVLGNLYSNSILAIVREYSTNAMDSHIAAGKPQTPITVQLPTGLHPVFTVSDEGVGLSEDEIYDIYGSYGASTKRESNDFNGQLGFGCKSAFSYTDQFTVTSVKDGYRKAVIFSLDENGMGNMTKMAEEETDAPNGVSVSIPVKNADIFKFEQTAKDFYSYWMVHPKGVPEYNSGVETLTLKTPQGYTVVADLVNNTASKFDNLRIVMGNVAYPVPKEYSNDFGRYARYAFFKMAIHVNMGDVDFTPSREELKLNPKILEILKAAHDAVIMRVSLRSRDAIRKAETLVDAKIIASDLSKQFYDIYTKHIIPGFQYKGYDMSTINHHLSDRKIIFSRNSRGFSFAYEAPFITKDTVFLVVPNLVTNVGNQDFKHYNPLGVRGLKQKEHKGIRNIINHSPSVSRLVLVNDVSEIPEENKVYGMKVMYPADMEQFIPAKDAAAAAPRQPRGNGLYLYRSFESSMSDALVRLDKEDVPVPGSTVYAIELDGNKPIFKKKGYFPSNLLQKALVAFRKDKGLVYAYRSGNKEKLEAQYNLIPFHEALAEYLEAYVVANSTLAQSVYSSHSIDNFEGMNDLVRIFDSSAADLEDPDLRTAILESKRVTLYNASLSIGARKYTFNESELMRSRTELLQCLMPSGYVNELVDSFYPKDLEVPLVETVMARYPLLTHISHSDASIESVREYVNTVYIASHKEK